MADDASPFSHNPVLYGIAGPPTRAHFRELLKTVGLICIILVTAAAVRFAFISQRPVTAASLDALPDQKEYLEIGQRFRRGDGLSFYDPQFHQNVFAYRMPAYPWLISNFERSNAAWITQCLQVLADTSTVLAAILIGLRLGGRPLGLLAGIAVAINPYLISFTSLILTESFFAALLAWGLVGLLGRSTRSVGVILLIAAVYLRPSALGLGIAGTAIAFARGQSADRQMFNGLGATALVIFLTVASLFPWATRNRYEAVGEWVWLTTNDGFTAYDSFNPDADGSSNQAKFRARVAEMSLSEVARSDYLSSEAKTYALTHPSRVITLAFAKLGRFWSPIPLSADFGGRSLYVVVGGLYVVPLFVFAGIGILRGGLGRRATLILLLPAIYFSAVHSLAVGSLRYRIPCDVPLAVLAAAGVMSFVRPKAIASLSPLPAEAG